MIEIPETYVLAEQINKTLIGKKIIHAIAGAHPHSFAWFNGDPAAYAGMLTGQTIQSSNPGTGYTCGGNTEIVCDDFVVVISTPIKYHTPGAKLPKTHQLLLQFDDDSHMSCTVQMWGAMFCAPPSEIKNTGHFANSHLPDPLTDAFDEAYFEAIWKNAKPSLSAKALLATEQRIPGLGNGVVQDILYNAQIHPKRKLVSMQDSHMEVLYKSVKSTILAMKEGGGRDTERDLFNNYGNYKTILSKKTISSPCIACGGILIRQAFLGGNIYFCELCQPMEG